MSAYCVAADGTFARVRTTGLRLLRHRTGSLRCRRCRRPPALRDTTVRTGCGPPPRVRCPVPTALRLTRTACPTTTMPSRAYLPAAAAYAALPPAATYNTCPLSLPYTFPSPTSSFFFLPRALPTPFCPNTMPSPGYYPAATACLPAFAPLTAVLAAAVYHSASLRAARFVYNQFVPALCRLYARTPHHCLPSLPCTCLPPCLCKFYTLPCALYACALPRLHETCLPAVLPLCSALPGAHTLVYPWFL